MVARTEAPQQGTANKAPLTANREGRVARMVKTRFNSLSPRFVPEPGMDCIELPKAPLDARSDGSLSKPLAPSEDKIA
jgi:hypothetical protein